MPVTDQSALAEIKKVIAGYYKQMAVIRADGRLNDQGRRELLQEAYDKAHAQVTELRAGGVRVAQEREAELRRELFGHPGSSYRLPSAADHLARRDADSRVAECRTPEQLGVLMERGRVNGDESLVRAGFARAWDQSQIPGGNRWAVLVKAYVEEHPWLEERVLELGQLTGASPESTLADSILSGVPKPAELRTSGPAQVRRPTSADAMPGFGDVPVLM